MRARSSCLVAVVVLALCGACQPGPEEPPQDPPPDQDIPKAPPKATPEATSEATPKAAPKAAAPTKAEPAPSAGDKLSAHDDRLGARYRYQKLDADQKARHKQEQQQARELLNQGRAAVRAKNYPEGVKLLRQSLKLRPEDPAALGELGWAAFLQKEYALARSTTARAIHLSRDPRQLGALYYNLGRALEAQGHLDQAATAYRQSLARRPGNQPTQARLDALKMPSRKPGLEQMCQQAMQEWLCGPKEQVPEEELDQGVCTCQVQRSLKAASPGPLEELALLSLDGHQGGGGGSLDGVQYLALKVQGSWKMVGLLADTSSPGVSYLHNSGQVQQLGFQQLLPAQGEEVLVRTSQYNEDGDYGANSFTYEEDHRLLICAADPTPTCTWLTVGQSWGRDQMLEGEPYNDPEKPYEEAWSLQVVFQGEDKVKITRGEGKAELPESHKGLLQVTTVKALLAHPAAQPGPSFP